MAVLGCIGLAAGVVLRLTLVCMVVSMVPILLCLLGCDVAVLVGGARVSCRAGVREAGSGAARSTALSDRS